MKQTVKSILQKKGHQVWTISPDASAFEALEVMADKNVGALVVVDSSEKPLGIFSERDYARKVILKDKTSKDTSVRELMTDALVWVSPDLTTEQCMILMTTQKVRHLPVLEDGELVGVLSIGDIVDAVISQQQFTIEQLKKYISGNI